MIPKDYMRYIGTISADCKISRQNVDVRRAFSGGDLLVRLSGLFPGAECGGDARWAVKAGLARGAAVYCAEPITSAGV